jgi:hypothetical protein
VAPAFVLTETLLQEGTDLHQRGRVFSLRDFAMRGLFQVSIWIAAAAVPLLGTSTTLLIAAGLIAAAGVFTLTFGRGPAVPAAAGSTPPEPAGSQR